MRRLEDLRGEVDEERLAVAVSRTGRAQESIAVAQHLVEESPYRERRWELLALALYAAGRQAEALDAVARAKRVLRDGLGLDPGDDLVALERAILGHDPTLPQGRAPRSSQVCPYQGLTAFQPEHHDLFVGRETTVAGLPAPARGAPAAARRRPVGVGQVLARPGRDRSGAAGRWS